MLRDNVAGIAGADDNDFLARYPGVRAGIGMLTTVVNCTREGLLARKYWYLGLTRMAGAKDDVSGLERSFAAVTACHLDRPDFVLR